MSDQTNAISFSPKGNYILLEALPADSRTAGGIWIPDNARQKINMGRILEFGPNINQQELALKTGELVIFPFHAEYRIPSHGDGKEYILILATDVIAGDNCTSPTIGQDLADVMIDQKLTPTGRKAPIGLNT